MSSDRLTDSLDRPWVPGTLLGRGTWGRSRIVRDPQGREAVLKEPLTEADFPADAPLPDEVLAACRACAREQATLLHEGGDPHLPRLESTVELGGGRLGLILPRYSTLQRRIERGMPLGDVLALVHRIASALAEAGRVHGNLRPSNIVFGERDVPFLADQATPALAAHHVRLMELADARHWMPPEAKARPTSRWDTWALCQILHGATLVEPSSDERPAPLPLARGGLDKVALATLKDAAHAKLSAEDSNPRFRGRVTDRIGALLSRGLSSSWEPSPPYRFSTARDLAERVSEILALLQPRVVEVGRLLLPASAVDGVFQSGAELALSCTVGCTQGIADHEDLVCGLQLVDLDATGDPRRPVEDTKIVVQVHPSGRLRFQLVLPAVPPGRYRVRVAFAVKDSGHEPQVVSGEFEVRPPPGYVPPRLEPERGAILFPGRGDGARAEPATSAGRDAPAPRGTSISDPGSTPGRESARPAVDRGAEPRAAEPRAAEPRAAEPRAAEPRAAEPRGADARSPSAAVRARGTDTGRDPATGARGSDAPDPSSSGVAFPRPVAPPQEEFDLAEAGRPSPSAARRMRARAEPVTDATLPEPNVWPPIGRLTESRGAAPSVDEPVTLPPRGATDPSDPGASAPRHEPVPAPDLRGTPELAASHRAGSPAVRIHQPLVPDPTEPPHIAPPALIDTDAGVSAARGIAGGTGLHAVTPSIQRRADPPLDRGSSPSGAEPARPRRPAAPRSDPHVERPRTTPSSPSGVWSDRAEAPHPRPPDRPPEPRVTRPVSDGFQATDELPPLIEPRPPTPWWGRSSIVRQAVDAIRRDSYVAVGAAVAASLVLVLLTSALLKAC